MATSPIDLHWNLTTLKEGTLEVVTYPTSALPTLDNNFFHITDEYIEFWAPVAGSPTAKSSKTRTELREYLPDGSGEQNWLATGGNHSMGASFTVLDVPDSVEKPSVFVGQIHADDGDSPLLKFKYEHKNGTGRMIISYRPSQDIGPSDFEIFPGIPLGTRIQYYVKVSSTGQLSAYVEVNKDRRTFTRDLKDWVAIDPAQKFYFKAGVYNNAEPSTSTGADDGSRARFYKFTTTHA